MATLGTLIYDRYGREGGSAFPDETGKGMTLLEFFVGQALASFKPGECFGPTPDDAADWAIQTALEVIGQLQDYREARIATPA